MMCPGWFQVRGVHGGQVRGGPPNRQPQSPQTPRRALEGCSMKVSVRAADLLWLTAHVPWMPASHVSSPRYVIDRHGHHCLWVFTVLPAQGSLLQGGLQCQ